MVEHDRIAKSGITKSAEIRARVNHPIIDCDGHMAPLGPNFLDYLRQVGGSRTVERFMATEHGHRHSAVSDKALLDGNSGWLRMSPQERRDAWIPRPTWWFPPTENTLDRATSHLPRLLHERMDNLGIDFTVLYLQILTVDYHDDELRAILCRAYNLYNSDIYRDYADRMTPAALIPMHTPKEALEELEYAVKTLGLKAVQLAGYVRRPIPIVQRKHPELARYAYRLDTFGLDSEYDYDPVWQKCVDLKVTPTFHSVGQRWGSRRSTSNYMYNHIGHFAAAADATCKSLFMGGVTKRFPTLKLAFLESGVSWACALYADTIGHWEKRNPKALLKNQDPAKLDLEQVMAFIAQYGDEKVKARMPEFRETFARREPAPDVLDDWAACGIERTEDIRDLFVPHFYFGCEADDPMNAWAFNTKVNPFAARMRIVLSSDISHWDVPDMTNVVAEAYEQVERELITAEDFRDFMFTNAVSLHAGMNPNFFDGSLCEGEVQKLLHQGK